MIILGISRSYSRLVDCLAENAQEIPVPELLDLFIAETAFHHGTGKQDKLIGRHYRIPAKSVLILVNTCNNLYPHSITYSDTVPISHGYSPDLSIHARFRLKPS